ncbi:hypothetical protein [Frankia sp. CIT1]|uniref:hypothetical protein n=1 Tax=Frankia sp. CIT1 TaxID=2880974 RepID=UPI001EF51198|nr:hypothetical protein [Frankia sp. CIT1]
MAPYRRDALARVAATAGATGIGAILVIVSGWTPWWAVPMATTLTATRALATSAAEGSALAWDVVERTAWTAIQAVVAVIPVSALGLSPELIPVVGAILAAVKACAARHVGDPHTAAILPARVGASP